MTDDRHACVRCAVAYRPDRTDGACPICRTPAPGHERPDERPGLDVRTLVLGVSALDFLLLAAAAWWVFG